MSLFNPWVLLAILIAICSSFGGGYYKGGQDEFAKQQIEIARLNAEARQKEQALVSAVNNTSNKLAKANYEAKLQTQKLHSAIDSGTFKLRIPVKAANCPVPTATDTAPASGDSVQATAELDGTIAKSLVAITDQGDANTRQLNACIDAYNAAYQTITKGVPQ
jgi:hypothetical protein